MFLAAWPAGQVQPVASILNAPSGTVTANAAIIPAGPGGNISTYGSNDTDLIIDINGYFAPPSPSGFNFYAVPPCRVVDTRNPAGSAPFSGTTTVNVASSGCQAPASAQAYVLNTTAVPLGSLLYLTLWSSGQAPLASTLNADPNTVTSNMAVVPASSGLIDAYAMGQTYLILDISGYFAP